MLKVYVVGKQGLGVSAGRARGLVGLQLSTSARSHIAWLVARRDSVALGDASILCGRRNFSFCAERSIACGFLGYLSAIGMWDVLGAVRLRVMHQAEKSDALVVR